MYLLIVGWLGEGPPYIRLRINPVRAIAGRDVTIACPYSGYPITSVKWSRGGSTLPPDLRHKLDSEGQLTITEVNTNDEGTYTCTVHANSGQTASRDIQVEVQSELIYIFFFLLSVLS